MVAVCPNNCTGRGLCDGASGTCVCDPGLTGAACDLVDPPCPARCTDRGRCVRGICRCKTGYSGRDCSVTCPGRCSGHGDCELGLCSCEPGYTGVDCSLRNDFPAYPVKWGLLAYSPLVTFVVYLFIATSGFLAIGYAINVIHGVRGTNAIPFLNYLRSSSMSDYQLKPTG